MNHGDKGLTPPRSLQGGAYASTVVEYFRNLGVDQLQ